MRAAERKLLEPWSEAFSTVFGEPPGHCNLEGLGDDAPEDLGVISFDDVVRPPDLIGGTGHFRHMPEMTSYVRSLGYDWNSEGRICTTPTPATFVWLMEHRGQPDAGFEPTYRIEDKDTLSAGPWLLLYLDGKIPLHVRSKEQYSRWLHGFDANLHREGFSFHVASFLHDLTVHMHGEIVHMLNYHLVPRSWIFETADRIKEALPERVAKWSEDGAAGPLTLTFFFDNDLNQYALQVWCRCRQPEDYARVFLNPDNIKLLDDALSLRISQTLEGMGDVASGDTSVAEGLQPLRFDLP